jgi:ribose-phosphate pyrophosphokinase
MTPPHPSRLVEVHLLELLFLAEACRQTVAAHFTAVVLYFGYAR